MAVVRLTPEQIAAECDYWAKQSEQTRVATRIQRKKDFVREAYMARCRTLDHMNHVEVAKMCADAFDYIESIND